MRPNEPLQLTKAQLHRKLQPRAFAAELWRYGAAVRGLLLMTTSPQPSLRDRLVSAALEWQQRFGVAPAITSALSEYDAARLIGHSDESFGHDCVSRTAVTKGCDLTFSGLRYQVEANRPSGRPGSFVTLVAKATNYDWDRLIWVLYDRDYVLQEAWQWTAEAYEAAFHHKTRLAPADMRLGTRICPQAAP